jgi:hypothetical protein
MLNQLSAAQVDHSLVRRLKSYTEPTLVVIDELASVYEIARSTRAIT